MKFFGGLFKVFGILLIILASVLCTVFYLRVGLEYGEPDVLPVAIGVWLLALIFTLCLWGIGTSLSQTAKLKARVQFLEQRLLYPAPAAQQPAESAPVAAAPVTPAADPMPASPEIPAKPSSRKWIPLAIAGVVVAIAIIVVLLCIPKNKTPEPAPVPQETQTSATMEPEAMTPPDMLLPEETPAEAPASAAVEVPLCDIISLPDFVDLCIWDATISRDVQLSIKTGNVTRHTGPDPESGQLYLCLTGTIINQSHTGLPVYDFFLGEVDIDGYKFEIDASECDVLDSEGSPVSEISPLIEYLLRIYIPIPDQLESPSSASFTFGFYDGFDNYELSSNRSFEKDPISLCPYQYKVLLY